MQNKIILDVDDLAFLLPGLDNILRIKQHYPNFKMTAFTIPMPKEFFLRENKEHFRKDKYKKWAKIINSYDWLEICVHGFAHTLNEFDCSYDKCEMMLKAIENLWKEIGLKYKKIFKAPYWQYSYDTLTCLRDNGWTVALDRNFPRTVPEGLKTYIYNWSFEEKLKKVDGIIKGHGHIFHTQGVNNALDKCYRNIIKEIPLESKFLFISEFLKENGKTKEN